MVVYIELEGFVILTEIFRICDKVVFHVSILSKPQHFFQVRWLVLLTFCFQLPVSLFCYPTIPKCMTLTDSILLSVVSANSHNF